MGQIFNLNTPPTVPGIYLLRHKPTGNIYVGQSKNLRQRRAEWQMCFSNHIGGRSIKMVEIIQETEASDWEFEIVIEMPDVNKQTLSRAEHKTIKFFEHHIGPKLLNTARPLPVTLEGNNEIKQANMAKSRILNDSGECVSYPEAAKVLGVTRQAVKKRLQKLRVKGIYEVTLSNYYNP